MEIETRLKSLISYDRDIFILQHGAMFPLWTNDSGFADTGLDYLTDRASKWYVQQNQESGIKQGDRVAVVGWGTAVVDKIDGSCIRAKLGDQAILRIDRKQVSWNKQNLRWETDTRAYCEADGNR
jgi:preprotein translocase subunit YajC